MSERDAFVVHAKARQAGNRVELRLRIELPPGVHIEPHRPREPFLVPTVLAADNLGDVEVDYPTPVEKSLGRHDLVLTVLQGSLTFVLRGSVPTGTDRVHGSLTYQPCVGGACLPTRTVAWEAPVTGETSYSILRAAAA